MLHGICEPHQKAHETFQVGALNSASLSIYFMDDVKGFVSFFFRDLSETREEIDVEPNPSYLSSQCHFVPTDKTSQEVQTTADACCH